MLQGEHYAILLTFINLPFVIKIFVLSIFEWPFEWPFYIGFTVLKLQYSYYCGLPLQFYFNIVTHADVIVWFVHLYGKIIHELQRVDYSSYRCN